jgi:hypothetical protein
VGGASPAALETSLACGGLHGENFGRGGGPKFFENYRNIFFKIFSRKVFRGIYSIFKKKIFPPGSKKQY